MRARQLLVNRPSVYLDLRQDDVLLQELEQKIKLASRFWAIVELCDSNPDPDSIEKSLADRQYLAKLGERYWLEARDILRERRSMEERFGVLGEPNETNNAEIIETRGRKDR